MINELNNNEQELDNNNNKLPSLENINSENDDIDTVSFVVRQFTVDRISNEKMKLIY